MQEPAFQQFRLVGGTALALQMGHRISIDLDLFTNEDFDSNAIVLALQPMGSLEILVDKPPFLQVRLDDVKVDFLKYPYPFEPRKIMSQKILLKNDHIPGINTLGLCL
jgi:hypothetical protein